MESYIRGVTTLHHYERISSRDLGLKELRIFGTEVVEDIDLRVTRQEGPGYSYGHCQKPGAKPEDGGPKMGLRPGYGLKPVVAIIIMLELVV